MFETLKPILMNQPLRILFSSSNKNQEVVRVEIKWIDDGRKYYQKAEYTKTQVFHHNFEQEELLAIIEPFTEMFKHVTVFTSTEQSSIRVSKKGKVFSSTKPLPTPLKAFSHNRKKTYVMPENFQSKAMVALNIMDAEGNVFPSKRDKYKQINRFLEMIEDVIDEHLTPPLRIVDFGCGKSYLTFIVYEYFTQIKHIPVEMVGLDLKADVIDFCNQTARKFGYDQLHFEIGDIAAYNQNRPVDIMISLHACNTATDYALYQAIRSKAKVIMAVPCCHKELLHHGNFSNVPLIGNYGLSKERVSALLTDNVRCALLGAQGYKVDQLEMFDLSHSPKNILIRAVYTSKPSVASEHLLNQFHQWFDVELTLERLLKDTL